MQVSVAPVAVASADDEAVGWFLTRAVAPAAVAVADAAVVVSCVFPDAALESVAPAAVAPADEDAVR